MGTSFNFATYATLKCESESFGTFLNEMHKYLVLYDFENS